MKNIITVLLIISLIIIPRNGYAAIAHDASSTSTNQTNVSSFSWSHTTSGADRVLIVGVSMFDITDSDRTVTGITYNSVAMTNIREDDNDTDDISTSIWYLINPATGSNTIEVTLNGTNIGVIGGAMSFTGVDQSAPIEANNGDTTAAGTSLSTSVTTVTNNAWVVDTVAHFNSDIIGAITAGGSQTEAWEESSGSQRNGAGSYRGPESPPASTAMAWTGDTNSQWSHSLAVIKPLLIVSVPEGQLEIKSGTLQIK